MWKLRDLERQATTTHFPKNRWWLTGGTTFVYCSWYLFFLFSDMCNSHLGAVCTVTAMWTTLRGPCETGLETREMWCPREMRGRHDTGRENCMSLKPMILTGIAAWFGSRGDFINMEQEAFPVTQSYVSSGGATVALRSFIQRNFILMGKEKLSFHLMHV